MSRVASNLLEWLLISAVSMAAVAAVYPDFVVRAQVRFTAGHDMAIPFQAAFMHAGYFIGDGLSLWNRLDQVNHAFLQLSVGYHSFYAIVEGYVFSLLQRLFDRPGEAFQAFHSIAYVLLAVLLRTAGAMALLSLYRVSRVSRAVALVATNTMLAQQTYAGVLSGFLFSLAPLVLYFVVRLLRRVDLSSFLWLLFALVFAFANGPLLAVGYFYVPIHLFLVTALIGFAIWAWQDRRIPAQATPGRLPPSPTRPGAIQPGWARVVLAAGLGLSVAILAANLGYLLLALETTSLHGSGLSGTEGRFEKIFDRLEFIKQGDVGPPLETALPSWVDFTRNDWWKSWAFIGAGCLALAIVGTFKGRHRERWLFACAFALVWLLQAERAFVSIGLPAHYIISLTDPFAFLIEHTQMSSLLSGYLLVPLIAFGADALRSEGRETEAPVRKSRDAWWDALAIFCLAGAAGYCAAYLDPVPLLVAGGPFVLTAVGLLARRLRPALGRLVGLLPFLLLAGDLAGFSVWINKSDYTGDRIQPRSFAGLVAPAGVDPNPVVLDYANPANRHVPLFTRSDPYPQAPTTDPEFPTPYAVYFIHQAYMGAFFETVFMTRQFYALNLYELRHKRYAEVPANPSLQRLIRADDRLVRFAPVGVDAARVTVADLLEAKAERWAVSLAPPAEGGDLPPLAGSLPAGNPLEPAPTPPPEVFTLSLRDAAVRDRDGFAEFEIALPKRFPAHLASTLISRDGLRLEAFLGARALAPVQGYLVRPFTFDVRNVASDALVVALPIDQPREEPLRLEVARDPLVAAIRTPDDDRVELEVSAPADGWLIWHNPLDAGWRASVGGRPAPILVANRIAMAVPVTAGRNRVVFEYATEGLAGLCKMLARILVAAVPLLGFLLIAASLALAPPPEFRARRSAAGAAS